MKIQMDRKSILMLGPAPPLTGGMASVIGNLTRSKLSKQCLLIVINTGKRTSQDRTVFSGILSQINLVLQIVKTIICNKSEIIHIHTCSGFTFWRDCFYFFLSRLFFCKLVWHIHGAKFDQFIHGMNQFQKKILKFVFEKSDSVIVLGIDWLKTLKQYAPKACWEIVANGVWVPDIYKQYLKENATFLFLGDLGVRKGVLDLVSATSIACENGFKGNILIAGGETKSGQENEIKENILKLHIENQVKLLGVISGDIKKAYLEKVDCFVLPSYAEGLPMALLEAMTYKLAVVVTDVGAIPEVVNNGQEGFLMKPGDVSALAEYMTILDNDVDLRRKMGTSGSLLVKEKYSVDIMAEVIIKIYSKILER